MKVKDLIASLGSDPEAEVVLNSSDHRYRVVRTVARLTAARTGKQYAQWHGFEHADIDDHPVNVVLLE